MMPKRKPNSAMRDVVTTVIENRRRLDWYPDDAIDNVMNDLANDMPKTEMECISKVAFYVKKYGIPIRKNSWFEVVGS